MIAAEVVLLFVLPLRRRAALMLSRQLLQVGQPALRGATDVDVQRTGSPAINVAKSQLGRAFCRLVH